MTEHPRPAQHRPFRTVLVANRGEIATRILRTARSLGLRTVVVHSSPDADAPFVRDADLAVELPGAAAADTYLDGGLILDAASRTGADAIHPGYGFLSENASFAAKVQSRGLVWVGPSPESMTVMASKVEAKARMAAVGVPVLPSTVVTPGAELATALEAVGLSLLVKASAGGGGKGMRLVERAEDLTDAVRTASSEAASSFGDGTVFLERYLLAPRHVEVQVLGDAHGNVIHLADRDCSIQRRHQKVIEEAPAPNLDDSLRARMADAAVAGAQALGYIGAGTFEFLVDGDEFFFLEMNTRLQVEHPVTEEVTGVDLVELQLRVAAGHPMPLSQDDVLVRGHAIEARLYAEDPANDWLPSTGTIHQFAAASGTGLRWDSGVRTGSVVTPHYDPMLAKAVAWAETRDVAASRLARSLAETVVHGVTTNAGLLARTLRHPAFLASETTTAFLRDHPEVLEDPERDATSRRHVAVAVTVGASRRRAAADSVAFAPTAFRNVAPARQPVVCSIGADVIDTTYTVDRTGLVELTIDDTPVRARLLVEHGDVVEVDVDGVRRRCTVDVRALLDATSIHIVDIDGATTILEHPRFASATRDVAAGSLVAPVPGAVVTVHVEPGASVRAGDLLVVLEAMKVEHQVRAPADGVVEDVLVAPGDSIDAHAPLVRMAST